MSFHRLTTPSYYISGGWPPAGYDYINLTPGDPNQAPADGAKSGGHPSDGTYFVAFGEDATSSHANRANKALATNCDFLDDVVSGEIPVLDEQTYANASGMGSAVITGGVFVGAFGTPNNQIYRDRLVFVSEKTVDRQLIVGGTAVVASLIHNGSGSNRVGQEATGFFTNPTVDFNVTIPAGTDFRIVFARRSSLVSVIPSKTDIARLILTSLRSMYREPFTGGVNWADATTNPACPVDTQLQKILTDLTSTSGQTGAGKIWKGAGPAWADTTTPGAGQLNGWLDAVVTALARTNTGDSGAGKIGAEPKTAAFSTGLYSYPPHTLAAVSITQQIEKLLAFINGRYRARTITSATILDDDGYLDQTIFLDSSGGFFLLTLTNPASNKGRRIRLVDISGVLSDPTKYVQVTRYSGTNINGSANHVKLAADYGQWWLTCDGIGWYLA